MKIKINDYESHEIRFPETINIKEFFSFVQKMNALAKTFRYFNRDDPATSTENPPSERKYIKLTREEGINFLKQYYTSDEERKKLFEKYMFISQKSFIWKANKIREDFKIQAKEVGLIRFPMGRESFDYLKIINQNKINVNPEKK